MKWRRDRERHWRVNHFTGLVPLILTLCVKFKGEFMIKLLLISLLIFTFSSIALAQTRCSSDSFGNTTCRDNYGNTTRGSSDSFGNETWRDNSGNTIRGSTDSFGNTTYRDNFGNTIRGSTDSFGNSIYRDNNGNSVRCSRDAFGNSTCR